MSSFLSTNTLLSDDVEKSSTLEDMYKALLGNSDAPSSFGNFGFSSDEEDSRSDAKSTENVPSTRKDEEASGNTVAILDYPSNPRLSLRKEKPTEIKEERKESTSSGEYEDDEDDDEDEDEEEEDDEESETEDECDAVDLPSTSISNDGSQKKNSHVPAPKLSVTHEEADIIQPEDIITDEELEAILDLDEEDTSPEPTRAAVVPTSASNDVSIDGANEISAAETEQSGETEIKASVSPVTSTPIKENLPEIQPQTKKDHDNIYEIEANHRVVNSIPVATNDSTDDEDTSGSDEEKTSQALEQVVIVRPQSHINNTQTPLHRDNTLCVEKKQPNGTEPVKSPVKHTYDFHSKFKNETSYRCCVCCLITLICFTIVAFILSLVAIANRCNCDDTKLLQSQLLLLMEEQNCPNSWRFYEGSCYGMPSISKKSYNNARLMCNQYGGDLVALTTKLENDYFSKSILCARSSYMKRDDPVYIGLKKSASKIHSWSSGETYQFTNSLTTTASNKECVQMTKNGSWTEVDCSTQLHFYCETKLSKNPTC